MKRLLSSILCVAICFSLCQGALAVTEYDVSPVATAKMTNLETGEVVEVSAVRLEDQRLTRTSDNIYTAECTAVFDVPILRAARGSDELEKDTGEVVVRIKVDYDLTPNKEDIRLNTVSGSWTPNSLISLRNREVVYHVGSLTDGHSDTQYPTSNSYSYSPDWGWGINYPHTMVSGAYVLALVEVYVPGMESGAHELEVTLNFPT